MYGTSYYGGAPYAGTALLPTAQPAQIVLTVRTNPPLPSSAPIPLGNDIIIDATFLGEAGELIEPSTVTCELEGPRGSMENPAMTQQSVGRWQTMIRPTLPGRWVYRIQANGTVIAAEEGVFWIANSAII